MCVHACVCVCLCVCGRLVEGELDHMRKAESSVQQQNATPREIQRRLEAIRKQKENKVEYKAKLHSEEPDLCEDIVCFVADMEHKIKTQKR